jgi:hypothetical protein
VIGLLLSRKTPSIIIRFVSPATIESEKLVPLADPRVPELKYGNVFLVPVRLTATIDSALFVAPE